MLIVNYYCNWKLYHSIFIALLTLILHFIKKKPLLGEIMHMQFVLDRVSVLVIWTLAHMAHEILNWTFYSNRQGCWIQDTESGWTMAAELRSACRYSRVQVCNCVIHAEALLVPVSNLILWPEHFTTVSN